MKPIPSSLFSPLHRMCRCIAVVLLFLTSTAVSAAGYSLVYSETADRAGSIGLFYANLSGDVYIRVAPDTGDIAKVSFYLDSSATPYRVDSVAPYDLAGGLASAEPINASTLGEGNHSIYTKVTLLNGRVLSFNTTFSVIYDGQPRPPTLTPIANQTMRAEQSLTLRLSASDLDGDAVTFSTGLLPNFAVFEDQGNGNATLRFSPLAGDVGRYVLSVSVSDGALSDGGSFILDVGAPWVLSRSPVLTPIYGQSMRAGETLSLSLSATDADGDTLSFSTSTLPGFATFNDRGDGTATVTLNPVDGDVGNYSITVVVSDGVKTDRETFTLQVAESLVVAKPPILAAVSAQSMWVGENVTIALSANDANGDALTFSTSVLPSFVVFDSRPNGSATMAFKPSVLDIGSYAITVTVSDGALSDSQTLMLDVTERPVGTCGVSTGSVVAVPFNYVTPVGIGKYITLAATSTLVEFNTHTVADAPNINWSRRYKAYKYGDGGGAVDLWILASVPPEGTLYEGLVALKAGDAIRDPDRLFYTPNNGFSGDDLFEYCAFDATGQSNVATVTMKVASTQNYPMPYGIPNPGFGIDETPPVDPVEWPAAEHAGFYYIDSDHPQCSNSNNSYGFPAVPRCAIPTTGASVIAGGKMVLAPSELPYVLRRNSWHLINFEGTAENPSWLIGNEQGPDKPIIVPHPDKLHTNVALRITGGHLRVSGVVFDGLSFSHRGGEVDNVVVRHSEIKNYHSTGGGGSTMGLSTGGNGVLAFNVYAHDNGVVEAAGLSKERDIHAFVGSNQTGFWLLDIRCDENAGDCVQLTNNNTTANVYVGRMVAHSEGENCVDIKDYNRVVVSESDCWDLRHVKYGNSGGNAQNFYVNDEGVQQNYVYFLNNRSWDTSGANYATANLGGRVYFIGNLSFASPVAKGFYSGAGNGSRYVYFNTFMNSGVGIYHFGSGIAMDRYVVGNVVDGAGLYQTRLQATTSVIDVFDYNFYSDVGNFASSGSTAVVHAGLAAFSSRLGVDQNSAEGVDLGFVNAGIYDTTLTKNSALRGAVSSRLVLSLPLLNDLSTDLSVDFRDRMGLTRLQASDYDAGALNYFVDGDSAVTEASVVSLLGVTPGDGDGDGVADSIQTDVSSFQSTDGEKWLTYRNNSGALQQNFVVGSAALSAPADHSLVYGMVQYDVVATVGERVTIEVYVTQNTAIKDYLLLSNDGQWKSQYAVVTHAGNKTKLVFSVIEGGEFDRDARANGTLKLAQGGVMVRSGFELAPYAHSFGLTELNTPTSSQVFTVSNKGSRALALNSVEIQGAYSDQFNIVADNCSAQSIGVGRSCTVEVNMQPSSVGSKSAWLQIFSDDPDNAVVAAFLNNYESADQQARRRLPPVLYSLTGLPEVMAVGQSYIITWELLGYHDNYLSSVVFFDCSGIDPLGCGSNYGRNFESSGVLSASSVILGEWSYNGVQSKRSSFSYTFTPTVAQFPNPADIVVRFYRKNSEDSEAGKGSLSLIIPGNLSDIYYDTSGRRIQKRVE